MPTRRYFPSASVTVWMMLWLNMLKSANRQLSIFTPGKRLAAVLVAHYADDQSRRPSHMVERGPVACVGCGLLLSYHALAKRHAKFVMDTGHDEHILSLDRRPLDPELDDSLATDSGQSKSTVGAGGCAWISTPWPRPRATS